MPVSTADGTDAGGNAGSSALSSSDALDGGPPPMDPEAPAPPSEEDNNSGYADPESPSSKADSASSSSEGVLVEHPAGSYQDPRGLQGDGDGGILVNIDGSMLEHVEEAGGRRRAEDLGRDEMFVDAPEQLGITEGRGSVGLEESMAVIEIGDNMRERELADEVARLRGQLEEREAECRRYEDERELIGSGIANLRYRLRAMMTHPARHDEGAPELLYEVERYGERGADGNLMASLPIHSMVDECSELASNLRSSMYELVQSEATIKELHETLNAKDVEIEDLTMEFVENSVSCDVIASYLDSVRSLQYDAFRESSDASIQRIIVSLLSVVQDSTPMDYSDDIKIYVLEDKTKLLIEKYSSFMCEIEHLAKCLGEAGYNLTVQPADHFGLVFEAVRKELLECKTKELHFLGKISEIEEEKLKVLEELDRTKLNLEESKSEVHRTKVELEQTEHRFITVKEKLSIAVTKGKSLVQQRDSLKQSLAEKTSELETSQQELRQKTLALESAEGISEELRCSKEKILSLETEISEREKVLHIIEVDISEVGFPEELQPSDATSRIKWLVDQIKVLEEKAIENSKIQANLSSFDLPEIVYGFALEYQINWLYTSFSKAREDARNLENELLNVQSVLGSCESQLLQAQREVENLTESLFVEKQGKDSLQALYEELTSEYEGATSKLSQALADKRHLVEVLGEITECSMEDEALRDIDALKDKCIEMIKERVNASTTSSSVLVEGLQRMQELLYVRSQEVTLYENILEEETFSQSERKAVLEELHRASSEVLALRNERDTLQKDLERSDERASLLKEKLSMAVKKGKGLVQEREGLKQSMDEKNSEIEILKQDLKLKESAISDFKEQLNVLKLDLEQSKNREFKIKTEKDEIDGLLLESNNTLQKIIESTEGIVVPLDSQMAGPMKKFDLIGKYIHEFEVSKVRLEQELNKQKEEVILQGNKLADAYVTVGSLQEKLVEKDRHITTILEEKSSMQVGRDSLEVELEKLREDARSLSVELEEAYDQLQLSKDTLKRAEDRISLLMDEKAESEYKSKLAIATLNTKIAECMEELAGTHGNLENQSAEVVTHLRQFMLLVKDETLPSLMTAVFQKSVGALGMMASLVEEISNQVCLKKLQGHPGLKLKTSISMGLSLPSSVDCNDDKHLSSGLSMPGGVESIPSFIEVTTALSSRTTLLGDMMEKLSSYLNENLYLLLQNLEIIRDAVFHLTEQNETLNLKVNNMDDQKDTQERELFRLQTHVKILLSACSDAIQALQFDVLKILDTDLESQKQCLPSWPESVDKVEGTETSFSEPEKMASKLLETVRNVKMQIEHLPTIKSTWMGAIEDLKDKLKDAELIMESVKDDGDTHQERVQILERELNSLRSYCNEMKTNIEDYQGKEILWKNKEEELLSLQHQLSMKNREEGKGLLSDSQLESLFGQVNKIETPFKELEIRTADQKVPSPADKIFYIVNNVAALQKILNVVVVERDNLQSIVTLHTNEIQKLKKIIESFNDNNVELQQKTKDLNDMTVTLVKIMQKFGGSSSEEKIDMRVLLSLLERLISSLSEESESFKLKAQELGSKLLTSQKVVDELAAKVRVLEDSIQTQSSLPETKERSLYEVSTSKSGSEISEIEDVGPLGRKSASPVPAAAAAHARTMRKGSSDHLALSIDMESDRLISYGSDDKGHLFKSLNSSGLVPKQGKTIADRIDSIWVSGGRILMGRPEARMGIIAYSILLHLWVLATII